MNKITRRAFLQVTGLTAAAAALSACSGGSGSSAGFHVAVPNDTTNEARALQLLETSCRTRTTPSSTPTTPSPPGWTP